MWSPAEILALSLVPKMRSVDLRRFVEEYASLTALLQAMPPELRKAKLFDVAQQSTSSLIAEQDSLFTTSTSTHRTVASVYDTLLSEAHKQQQQCGLEDVRIVSYWDEDYPPLLKQIFYPPTLLYVRGMLQSSATESGEVGSGETHSGEVRSGEVRSGEVRSGEVRSGEAHSIGIVGTRHCTDYGRMAAEQYATRFAEAGITVVSGLATGIDTFAHKASLKAGGTTYAVIASGIDKISPQYAASLAREISSGRGAVLSEYPCGVAAQRASFPRRNRIITGLSEAILVVESGEKGGSLITARFALDENRELFAIPGRIYSERSKGANLLIQRSEARLTLTPDDMLAALGIEISAQTSAENASELDALERSIYNALSGDPIHIETLAERTGASVQDLLFVLLQLEFKGFVRQLAGKQFMRLGT